MKKIILILSLFLVVSCSNFSSISEDFHNPYDDVDCSCEEDDDTSFYYYVEKSELLVYDMTDIIVGEDTLRGNLLYSIPLTEKGNYRITISMYSNVYKDNKYFLDLTLKKSEDILDIYNKFYTMKDNESFVYYDEENYKYTFVKYNLGTEQNECYGFKVYLEDDTDFSFIPRFFISEIRDIVLEKQFHN